MQRYHRVLAATDFSPGGDAAARQAFAVCAAEATVVLAHVIDVAPAPNPLYAHYAPGQTPSHAALEQMQRASMQALEALVPQDARREGVTVRLEVRTGSPVDTLLELARELPADVVVVGDSGRGALSRAFLGSVAQRIVHQAPCSVLLARPKQG